MSKFREFWIKPAYKPEDEDRISFCKVPKNDFEHVIEYAALAAKDAEIEKLENERDTLKQNLHVLREVCDSINDNGQQAFKLQQENQKLKKQLEVCREALEFYADAMSYSVDDYRGISGEMIHRCVLYKDMEEKNDVYSFAGRRARQALAEVENLK